MVSKRYRRRYMVQLCVVKHTLAQGVEKCSLYIFIVIQREMRYVVISKYPFSVLPTFPVFQIIFYKRSLSLLLKICQIFALFYLMNCKSLNPLNTLSWQHCFSLIPNDSRLKRKWSGIQTTLLC